MYDNNNKSNQYIRTKKKKEIYKKSMEKRSTRMEKI